MPGVPYTFGNATTSIPLTQLDANFNTGLTIGNTTIGLGNTTTTLGNVTMSNVTIISGTSNVTQNLANVTGTLAVSNGGTGLTTLTSGYIPYGNGTSPFNNSANLTYGGTTLNVIATSGASISYPAYFDNSGAGSGTGSRIGFRNGSTAYASVGYVYAPGAGGFNMELDTVSGSNMVFKNNNTEQMRIDSSGNVGIGVTPSAWGLGKAIEVGGLGSALWYAAVNNTNVMNNAYFNGSNYIYGATGFASQYQQNAGNHQWKSAVSGTAGGTVTFTQVLGVGKGTTLALEGASSASGTGIAFPATQSASSDANCLDDYEEGTWTPVIFGSTTGGVGTYNIQNGQYTKIGNRVFITCYLNWTAHTGTGNMRMSGLPFTSNSGANTYMPFSYWDENISYTSTYHLCIYGSPNSNVLEISQTPNGGGGNIAVPMDSAGGIMISGSYSV